MARANFVKKARKDNPVAKKGESYYWWKFKFGSKQYSKTQPKASQLTQSEFLGTIYDIDETITGLTVDDDFESSIQEITSDLEVLRDECEEKRDNMPEQLQDTGSGEILQNRTDSVQEMIDELEGVDVDVNEADIESDVRGSEEKEEEESKEDYNDRVNELVEDAIKEKKEEILSEIQEVSYNGE